MIQINKQSLCGSIASRIFQTNTVKPEAATRGFLLEKVVLEISQNSQENTCAIVSFLIKLQVQACNFSKKETMAQVFSYEFCEIPKNAFFTEHLRTTASSKLMQTLCFVKKVN